MALPDEAGAVGTAALVDEPALDGLHGPLHAAADDSAACELGAQAGLQTARVRVPEEGHLAPGAEVAGLPFPAAHLSFPLFAMYVWMWGGGDERVVLYLPGGRGLGDDCVRYMMMSRKATACLFCSLWW